MSDRINWIVRKRKWTRPIHGRIHTDVAGYHAEEISQLVEEMVDVALKKRS